VKDHSPLKAAIRRQWRQYAKEEATRRGQPLPADFALEQPGDGDLLPPTAQRVARRACCLAAVALRGLAGNWEKAEQEEFLPNFVTWFEQAGLDDEIEPAELETILAPAGALDERRMIDASWRWEGAAVLAASLGRIALPDHDVGINPQACGEACWIFKSGEEIASAANEAMFGPSFDRFAYADRILAVHWRLRQFVSVEQIALNFEQFARGVEWANFDLAGVRLIDKDLAIGDQPISLAPQQAVGMAMSIAAERHIAANWLIGWEPIYSAVENPT
jgi:hypothetical protein